MFTPFFTIIALPADDVRYPCSVCLKNVEDGHPSLLCPYCGLWSHNKCNDIKSKEYKLHQKDEDKYFCCQKCQQTLPYQSLNSNEFVSFLKYDVIETRNGANIKLTPTPNQQVIIDKLNNLITQTNTRIIYDDDSENEFDGPEFDQPISCSYYSCDDFVKAQFESNKNFSILHMNIHSIQLHIEELRILLEAIDYKFDIIAISESKLKDKPTTDISLSGFHPLNVNIRKLKKEVRYYTFLMNYIINHEKIWKFMRAKN